MFTTQTQPYSQTFFFNFRSPDLGELPQEVLSCIKKSTIFYTSFDSLCLYYRSQRKPIEFLGAISEIVFQVPHCPKEKPLVPIRILYYTMYMRSVH